MARTRAQSLQAKSHAARNEVSAITLSRPPWEPEPVKVEAPPPPPPRSYNQFTTKLKTEDVAECAKKGMTQREAADLLGVTVGTISARARDNGISFVDGRAMWRINKKRRRA